MPIKSVKMKISKNKKMCFFLMSQGSLNPKIRFLGQKVWPVARGRTHTQTGSQTDRHESDYRGHPFRVSGVFPLPIIKDRPKNVHRVRHTACLRKPLLHFIRVNIKVFSFKYSYAYSLIDLVYQVYVKIRKCIYFSINSYIHLYNGILNSKVKQI